MCVFQATIHFPNQKIKNLKRGHRLVVLPDYQGIGLGATINNFCAKYFTEKGFIFHTVQSQPALIASQIKDPKWRLIHYGRKTRVGKKSRFQHLNKSSSKRRKTATFRYIDDGF